jgi:two-component system response regulator AtoC
LIAATNRDLDEQVARGEFREDLLYRLNVVELTTPALRERLDDIPGLVECFLDRHAERLERPRPTVEPETLRALITRPWPGNVRELENAVERAVLLGDGERLNPSDFGMTDSASQAAPASSLKVASRVAAAETERRMILAALDLTGGNVTHAADRLGLSRRGLQLKIKELELR